MTKRFFCADIVDEGAVRVIPKALIVVLFVEPDRCEGERRNAPSVFSRARHCATQLRLGVDPYLARPDRGVLQSRQRADQSDRGESRQ